MKLLFSTLMLATLVIGGCASKGGQIASFEDLTTESAKEGLTKIPQYRVISITGLLPFSDIGGVHFYKAQRKPSTAIGLSHGQSYIVEKTITSNGCDMDCLANIRNNILEVKVAAANLIEDKINITRLKAGAPSASASSEEKTAYQTNLTKVIDHYNKTRSDLDEKHATAVSSLKHHGVIVFRWNTNTQKSGALNLGKLFGVSATKDETQSGFGLISGLKVRALYLGKDIKDTWGEVNTKSRYANRFEVTTYAIHAQHIMYMSELDLSSSLTANIKASYEQLANIGKTLKALDNIELTAALSKVSNLANMGVIGNIQRRKLAMSWSDVSQSELDALDGWQTIYAVKSDLSQLLKMMDEFYKTDVVEKD